MQLTDSPNLTLRGISRVDDDEVSACIKVTTPIHDKDHCVSRACDAVELGGRRSRSEREFPNRNGRVIRTSQWTVEPHTSTGGGNRNDLPNESMFRHIRRISDFEQIIRRQCTDNRLRSTQLNDLIARL